MSAWSPALGLAVALSAGCVTVYQPMRGLQRPVVVDSQLASFEGLNLLINCVPGGNLDRTGARLLCRKVGTLFSNQGASVRTRVLAGGQSIESSDADEEEGAAEPDITLDLSARMLHMERNAILWVLSVCTATLLPAVSEYTFAQDITIRDSSGFLLISDRLEGRFVRYFGAGAWSVNKLLDWTVREESEKLTGDVAKEDFSRDFYGQLSQSMFNAKMRRRMLRAAGAPASKPAAAEGGAR